MTPAVVTFWEPEVGQFRTGLLVKSGDKWAHLVVFEVDGLRRVLIPQEEEATMQFNTGYTRAASVERYEGLVARVGATQGARDLLAEARAMLA